MKRVMKALVMVAVPLGVAGVAYGIAYDGVGLSAGWAIALGWLAGLVAVFVVNRFWCYRAAFRFSVKPTAPAPPASRSE